MVVHLIIGVDLFRLGQKPQTSIAQTGGLQLGQGQLGGLGQTSTTLSGGLQLGTANKLYLLKCS